MNYPLAPEPTLRAALSVLYYAAYTTRNWTLKEEISREQINDLWEAIHVIPSLIEHWRGDEECQRELRMYLQEYDERWDDLKLEVRFDDALNHPDL